MAHTAEPLASRCWTRHPPTSHTLPPTFSPRPRQSDTPNSVNKPRYYPFPLPPPVPCTTLARPPVPCTNFSPAPGTVTTVWDPHNFPAGPPRSPSVIMHPRQNRPQFYAPLVPTQKSVTFTADGRFVASHSTLPLYRHSETDFPPLPSTSRPTGSTYQPDVTGGFVSPNFSFSVPSTTTVAAAILPTHPGAMLPHPAPESAVNGQNLSRNRAHIDLSRGALWNGGSNHRQIPPAVYQHGPSPRTPFTVLPFDGNLSWQSQPVPGTRNALPPPPVYRTAPVSPRNGGARPPPSSSSNEPQRIRYPGGTHWNHRATSGEPAAHSSPIATDVRLLPVEGHQVWAPQFLTCVKHKFEN